MTPEQIRQKFEMENEKHLNNMAKIYATYADDRILFDDFSGKKYKVNDVVVHDGLVLQIKSINDWKKGVQLSCIKYEMKTE